MPFEKGKPKTGGRPKGGKNKDTIIKEQLGITRIDDLEEDLLKIYSESIKNDMPLQNGMPIKYVMASKIGNYVFTQKKEIDLRATGIINIITNPKLAGTK